MPPPPLLTGAKVVMGTPRYGFCRQVQGRLSPQLLAKASMVPFNASASSTSTSRKTAGSDITERMGGTLIANTFAISDLYHSESATYAAVFGDFINFSLPESANRVIVVPPFPLPREELRARAKVLAPTLKPMKVKIERLARALGVAADEKPDWDEDARILTDQYAPANLLQGD